MLALPRSVITGGTVSGCGGITGTTAHVDRAEACLVVPYTITSVSIVANQVHDLHVSEIRRKLPYEGCKTGNLWCSD
jgi:hypothetical protein